jgi:myo-inositol-1-phosphate synthase
MGTPLRILTPGLGAVSTTLMAGVMLSRMGLSKPIGALTEYADIDGTPIRDLVVSLDDIRFAAWDPFGQDALTVARESNVLSDKDLEPIAEELAAIKPMTAVFDASWVSALEGASHVKTEGTWMDKAAELIAEMGAFKAAGERTVMVWCASTEAYRPAKAIHFSLADFERAMKENDPGIAPSQVYAYAALRAGVPYANGAPNVSVEVPALMELAERQGVPICGKDFKTGQTLMKTVIAPGLKSRKLGIRGWFSTNILGNRDGLVLDDPENFRSKEVTKLGVLEDLLQPETQPDLYGNIDHAVRINYYPPRGDEKEGWDNIDLFGWLNYPMQIKVNFLCRDSILAAPLVLDLARLLDLAGRTGQGGTQDWLGYYFKSPMEDEVGHVEHDLFVQESILLNKVAEMADL